MSRARGISAKSPGEIPALTGRGLTHADYLCIDDLCDDGGPLTRRNERKDLLPGTLEMLILQTLRRGALHGYAIAQYIQQTSQDVLQVEEGSLYPALQRLLRERWVSADWGI